MKAFPYRSFAVTFFGVVILSPGVCAADLAQSLEELRRGGYEKAIPSLQDQLRRNPTDAVAAEALVRGLTETGRYEEAQRAGRDFLSRVRTSQKLRASLASLDLIQGRLDDLERTLAGSQDTRSQLLLGLAARQRGQKREAQARFRAIVARYEPGAGLGAEELADIAEAMRFAEQYQDSNRTYRQAVELDPKNPGLRIRWGQLYLEKYNAAEAQQLFREALEINPNSAEALVAMARSMEMTWSKEPLRSLEKALRINPSLPDAQAVLARLALQEGDFAEAEQHLSRALAVNPRHLESLSLVVVSAYLRGQDEEMTARAIPAVLEKNPSYGTLFEILGDFAVLQRQFEKAVRFYAQGISLDPELWSCYSSLGINLLRLGDERRGTAYLERAYAGDPYNLWTVNTLRLLDSFPRYEQLRLPLFQVRIDRKEVPVLWPYVSALLQQAYDRLTERYGSAPEPPIFFEMYPDHEDFAVRTLGLPGLGALGASFGRLVAMDSPSARPPGTFHWGSTLWHEMAHVVHLLMTQNRISRWFAEGLAVHEERRSLPGWGHPLNFDIIRRAQARGPIPLQDLNAAFVRARDPGELAFGYYQASMVCEFLSETFGLEAIRKMLSAYGQGTKEEEEILAQVTGLGLEEMDRRFREYWKKETGNFWADLDFSWARPDRTRPELERELRTHPRNYFAHLALASLEKKQGNIPEAISHYRAACEIFPDDVGEESPYVILAELYSQSGEPARAAAVLEEWKSRGGFHPNALKKLAALQKGLRQPAKAAQALEAICFVHPFDEEVHRELGEMYLTLGDPRKAIQEFHVALALDPVDLATAHFNAARAYFQISDADTTRKHLLRALEAAPGFRPAQKMLLELKRRDGKNAP